MRRLRIIIPTLQSQQALYVGQAAVDAAGLDAAYYIANDSDHRGFTATVNRGMVQLPPDTDVCLLNDDITDFPDRWLARLSGVLYMAPHAGLVGPAGDKSTEYSFHWNRDWTGLQEVDHLSFWCVLIRREVIDSIGILDKRLIHYASDFDYCDRARLAGWRCVWDKDVILNHAGSASGTIVAWRGHDLSLYQRISAKRKQPEKVADPLAQARKIPGSCMEPELLHLYRVAQQAPHGEPFVELGAYLGQSTAVLWQAAKERGAELTTIDNFQHPAHQGKGPRMLAYGLRLAECVPLPRIVAGESAEVPDGISRVGFLFVDTKHTPQQLTAELTVWTPLLVPGAVVAFHDYGWMDRFAGMTETIDLWAEAFRGERLGVEGHMIAFKVP